ncbi:MAG: tetratricopeptide repeat protein [Silvibacterium sp.]|nr:tetratricopeptide repeat protein [Silvibacterium sp.]
MRFFLYFTRSSIVTTAALLLACSSFAQQPSNAASGQAPKMPPPPKPPALVEPGGPSISLQTSEAVFDIAAGLNACGYDNGLAESDPVREHIREQINQASQQSVEARDARFHLCEFINSHRLAETGRDLAQYVSLALYVTPPPELAPSVEMQDLPPDSTQVVDMLPLLRAFSQAVKLHTIWVENRSVYDEQVARLHDPLTRMITDTNIYLKMPVSSYEDRRFLVVIEPLLSPAETNARVYGTNYVVVASPVNGRINMSEVRHTYLHYEIEPLLYARATAMDRLLPVLKVVRDAPLDFLYRSDIVSLVIECMIRAIEARTMETGVEIPKIPANTAHSELDPLYRARNAALQKDDALREQLVSRDMAAGFVLTQYFYEQLIQFERSPASLKESIGEMVYGMDVPQQMTKLKGIRFAEEGSADVVRRASSKPHGLDLAELDLVKGDPANAASLSETALKQHTAEAGRANFILARADLMTGKMEEAETALRETLRLSSDPRMLAWAHIYLGRILDVQEKRDEAIVEYKAALEMRDTQPDTRFAAENGMKQPFALPHHASSEDDDSDPPSKTQAPPAPSGSRPQ